MSLGVVMINLKNHPTLAWVVDYWPSVVLVPTVLLVIAGLVLVTRCWTGGTSWSGRGSGSCSGSSRPPRQRDA
jgi:hypothetical protein